MMTNLKRTWNDNPFDQWTEEELLSMEGQGICYGKGGGSAPPPPAPAVQTQVTQSEFPTELKPFVEDIFGKAQGIQRQREAEGFQAFEGPLQAGFDPAQTRAFEAIENIPGSTAPLFDEATSFARQATTAPTDPAEVAAFMNPFLRNVTDIQKREAERVADVQEQQLGAQAARAGAFGGSRAAILEAERQRNLGQQLDDIEARGLAASFQDAQTRLGQQRQREAAGATQLASLGSAIPAQQLKELGALSGVGAARQTQGQRAIDLARQEFEREESFPLRTLQEFSSILRGFPIDPTERVSSQQFSAAQPLSTQLLGVGTQALGALGAAGFKPFGQAGGMVKEMPVGYQGGGALSSLIQKTQDLDASPVIQMAKGGDIMSILSPMGSAMKRDGIGGLASFLSPAYSIAKGKMPGGLRYLQNLLSGGGGGGSAPPPVVSGPSQEDIDKQIDDALRQRAAQAQQAGARGTPQGQVSSQVRQSFKGGGGLQQMVNLPSNRVRFGKDAYQDVSFSEEEIETLTTPYVRDPQSSPFMNFLGQVQHNLGQDIDSIKALNLRKRQVSPMAQAVEFFTGTDESLEGVQEQAAKLGEASVYLQKKTDESRRVDSKDSDNKKEEKKTKRKDPDRDTTSAKKKKGDDLYLSPEQAGSLALIDYEGFEDKTPMINKPMDTMSVLARNMRAGTGALSAYMKAKKAQELVRDKAVKAQAAATAKARRDRLGDQKIMSEIKRNLDANDSAALNALTKLLESPEVQGNTEAQVDIQNKIYFYINKAQKSALTDLTQRGSQQYGGSPSAMNQIALERKRAKQLAAEQKAKKKE